MGGLKKYIKGIGDVLHLIFGTIAGYIGVISNIVGTIMGILASMLVVCGIVGICVYVKVLPMVTEARETVFDKLVNMSENDFLMKEDTVVYDSRNKKVGSVNAGQYKYVKISDISPYIYEGYIAVEDRRFKTHAGVDVVATVRAGVALLKNHMEITQGGSTITQQVIKNNLLTQDQNYTRKLTEIMLAPSVETKFSKDQIMEFYCNSNFYGNLCYGVGAASEYYFNKKAADLDPQEAALLIGISNNPSAYDPISHPDFALEKRNSILKTMKNEGAITQKEYNAAVKTKLVVQQNAKEGKSEGYVVSYAIHCAALSLLDKEDFEFKYTFKDKEEYDAYNEKVSKAYGEKCDDIRSGGYKIYTSINMNKQKKLQKAVNEGLAYSTEKNAEGTKYALQGAAVCVDNNTNYVVAVVGGRGTKDAYNRAYLSARQSGSSIKPLIDYTPGFESGVYSPSTIVNDHKFENGPQNAGGGYYGNIHVREAVARSLNTVAWQVLDTITPAYGLSFLDKMHFRNLSYIDNDNLALSLGGFTEGVRVVDMAKGYSALANNGKYSERTCIRKIERASDGTVYKNNDETTQVYSEDAAWMMTDVLKGVLSEDYGTGHRLKLENKQIAAGKTGTTNSSKDVWFCGYTKYYTTVVWAGYDTPRAMPGASGASVPGAIWKNYMDNIHTNLEPQDFIMPSTVCMAKYDGKGDIVEGTAVTATGKRKSGMDYFSQTIIKEKAEYAAELKDKKYQKKVLLKLEAFEKLYIESIADYYTLKTDYEELRDLISAIVSDSVRKSYAKRAKDKYDSLNDETLDWEKIVSAYEKQRQEENVRLAEEKAEASEKAKEEQKKRNRIALARTRIKRLHGRKYRPSNVDELITAAEKALSACKEYNEYAYLKSLFEAYKEEILSLPSKEEAKAGVNNNKPTNKPNASPTVKPSSTPWVSNEPTDEPVTE